MTPVLPPEERAPSPWGAWLAVATAWCTLNATVGIGQYHDMRDAAGAPTDWGHALRTTLVSAYLWVPVIVATFWLVERYPVGRGRRGPRLALHSAAALGAVLLRALAVVALNPWVGWYAELPPFGRVLLRSVENNLLVYVLLVGAAHAAHYARQYRRRETQLAQARLAALQAQLHPHFLFNALNTVSALVHEDPDAADRMIARLSDLLRHTLESAGTHEVTLREEVAFLAAYLEIEQARFEDRLRVEWAVAPDVLDAAVPHLVLQPLVENAIRHGVSPRPGPGMVWVQAARAGQSVRLTVRDDGVGVRSATAGGGVGLANTRARLVELYGDAHGLTVAPAPGGGTVVTVTLPFRPLYRPEPRAAAPAPAVVGAR
jgi:signal transduction histidine kinase